VDTKQAFDDILDEDKLISLAMSPADEKGAVTIVFTSKRLLTNAWNCYKTQNTEGIILSADYKWKLTNNGWPLGVLGTDLSLQDDKMVHSLIPFIFNWATSESENSFSFLLDTFIKSMETFFGIKDLNVISATIDHSASLRCVS
jgi:hypothetical protein